MTQSNSPRHTWRPGASRTVCGLVITPQLKMRQAPATRICKRCQAAKRLEANRRKGA